MKVRPLPVRVPAARLRRPMAVLIKLEGGPGEMGGGGKSRAHNPNGSNNSENQKEKKQLTTQLSTTLTQS